MIYTFCHVSCTKDHTVLTARNFFPPPYTPSDYVGSTGPQTFRVDDFDCKLEERARGPSVGIISSWTQESGKIPRSGPFLPFHQLSSTGSRPSMMSPKVRYCKKTVHCIIILYYSMLELHEHHYTKI